MSNNEELIQELISKPLRFEIIDDGLLGSYQAILSGLQRNPNFIYVLKTRILDDFKSIFTAAKERFGKGFSMDEYFKIFLNDIQKYIQDKEETSHFILCVKMKYKHYLQKKGIDGTIISNSKNEVEDDEVVQDDFADIA